MKENSFEDIKKLAGTKYFGSIIGSANGIIHLFSDINYFVEDGTFNIYKGEEGKHFTITSSMPIEVFNVDGLRVTTSIDTDLFFERFDGKDWDCCRCEYEGLRIAHKDNEKYLLLCSLFNLELYNGKISDIESINRQGLRFRRITYSNDNIVYSGIRYHEACNGEKNIILPAFNSHYFNCIGELECFDESEDVTYEIIDIDLLYQLSNGQIDQLNDKLSYERLILLKQDTVSVTKPIEVTESINEYKIPDYLVSTQNSKNLFQDIMNNVKNL